MYFPEDMNFQYFFFDTYIGYFLQALPIALFAGVIYWIIKYRSDKETPILKKIFSSLFVCYLVGLFCLTWAFSIVHILWYTLLYFRDSGMSIDFFSGDFNFVPDFLGHINAEVAGNFLMFLPFGILYPLFDEKASWKKSLLTGYLTVLIIEILQPVFGRAFDINDIILNTLGIIISTSCFFGVKRILKKSE